ncbi:hypothetical protein M3B82_011145 [Micrococcus luteus]|nr:hypothetical protein [Micrococcus luteus]
MAALLGSGSFYATNTLAFSYATNTLGVYRLAMINATLVAAVVPILVNLLVGRVDASWGPDRVTMAGGINTAPAAWPLFAPDRHRPGMGHHLGRVHRHRTAVHHLRGDGQHSH